MGVRATVRAGASRHLTNWAGNYTYEAARVHAPATVPDLQELLSRARSIRALGSRHSFNDVADGPGDLVSLERLPRVVDIDRGGSTVTVGGAARYGDICRPLHEAGFALANLASLPHISVAGACATGTHGSGNAIGNLSSAVAALEMVTASGDLRTLRRGEEAGAFNGAVVALGALGVVTRVSLDLEAAFDVQQEVFEDLPTTTFVERFDEITATARSVSFFTDWRGPQIDKVWLKRRVAPGERLAPIPELFGARRASRDLHPIRGLDAGACTPQLGVPGPWFQRLPHFRMDHTPSSGNELQSEYFVDRRHAVTAFEALDGLRPRIARLIQVSEVRTIASDELWLSPAYQRDSVAFHFTWRPDPAGVLGLLPDIEAAFAPFEPRPHWAKLFTMRAPELRARYERLPAFAGLAGRLDPDRKFRNDFVERYLLAET
jgi:xylitol oxidase